MHVDASKAFANRRCNRRLERHTGLFDRFDGGFRQGGSYLFHDLHACFGHNPVNPGPGRIDASTRRFSDLRPDAITRN